MFQDYQTRQLIIEEGNPSGAIRTGHNQHTHTGNTRQPDPQLKSSLCSSAISSHNSRDVIPGHNNGPTSYFKLFLADGSSIGTLNCLKEERIVWRQFIADQTISGNFPEPQL